MARVLVTGGAGFIGSHTVERLIADGHAVTALDNLASGTWANLAAVHDRVQRVAMDVRDADELTRLVQFGQFDAIIHLAAWASVVASIERPAEAHAINVGGTLHVLEAARAAHVQRVVLASSTAVYGRNPTLPTNEDAPLLPLSPYAAHKAESELLCNAYRAVYGIATVALRYFNAYGSRQPSNSPYSGVVAIFAQRLADGHGITVFGDGEQSRDFIHVADVAAINVRAALGPDPGLGAINVGSGVQTSILLLIDTLRTVLHADTTVTFEGERAGDVRHSQANIARLRERLAYQPAIDLQQGLRDLLDG